MRKLSIAIAALLLSGCAPVDAQTTTPQEPLVGNGGRTVTLSTDDAGHIHVDGIRIMDPNGEPIPWTYMRWDTGRVGPVKLPDDQRVKTAWAVVENYHPEYARRVTEVRIGHRPDAYGWVMPSEPTVIHINDEHVLYSAMSTIEGTLAHEMMHVAQFFDSQRADRDAREREAATFEQLFSLRRRAVQSALSVWWE
jgi:uncharacterized protein YceK